MIESKRLLTETIRMAEDAGKILRENFQSANLKIEQKPDYAGSIVTRIDRDSEELIIDRIRGIGGSKLVVSEESGETHLDGTGYVWYVDPLDGTQNYVRGIPHFCVSIAAEHAGQVLFGVIHNPVTNQTWVAEREKGAYLNGTRIKVSKNALKNSAIIFEWWNPDRNIRSFEKLLSALIEHTANLRLLGSVALNLALVGSGNYDGLVTVYSKTPRYEIAAGAIIAEEAGAKVTNSNGESWACYRNSIIAGNPSLHAQLLDLAKAAR